MTELLPGNTLASGCRHFYCLNPREWQSVRDLLEAATNTLEHYENCVTEGESIRVWKWNTKRLRRAIVMVEATTTRRRHVHATRGKAVRAEPIAAKYERGEIHHVGTFAKLEEEMISFVPGSSGSSPNRMDAMVWGFTELFPLRNKMRWGPA